MSVNPLLKFLKINNKEEEKYSNPYDDGSVWSASNTPTVTTPSTSQFLQHSDTYNPLVNALVKSENLANQSIDNLSAPRKQMNYYSEQLEDLGQEPVAPKTEKKGILGTALDILNKVTALPRSVGNALGGAIKGGITEDKKQQNYVEQTESYKKLKEMGYVADNAGNVYHAETGEQIGGTYDLIDGALGKNKINSSLSLKERGELVKLGVKASQEARDLMKSSGAKTEYLKEIGKGTAKGFIDTYKNAFGDLSYDEVSDFGNVMKYKRTGNDDLSKVYEKQTDSYGMSTMLRKMGVEDEKARLWQEGLTDVGISMMTSQFTDLNDVGKTIKYLNKTDDIKNVNKIVDNVETARKITKNNVSYDMFADSMKASAKANKVEDITEEMIEKAYKGFQETTAKKLLTDTDKVLGGMGNFTGLKLGNRTIVTTETLDKIASNKIYKGLTEVGLSLYSPAGALLNGTITNKIGEAINSTEIGSKMSDTLQKGFGGKNSQYKVTAKKLFKEQGAEASDEILKNINMVESSSIYKRFKDLQDKHSFKKYKEYANSGEDLEQITRSIEGREIKVREGVEKEVVNETYVEKVRSFLQEELGDENSRLARDIVDKSDDEIKKLSNEITELENIPKATSINFEKELSKIKMSEYTKYFNEAITMSPEDLAKHLEAEGVSEASTVANKVKTVANNLMDNIEKNNPALINYLKGVEDFNLSKLVTNYNYDPNDMKSITKEINDIKAKNRTYIEAHGNSSEYFENKIAKLEIEKDRLKAKKKLFDKKKSVKKVETKKVEPEVKNKKETVDDFVKKHEKDIEGVELDSVKGSEKVFDGTTRDNKSFDGFEVETRETTVEKRRSNIVKKLKEMDIEISDLDKAYIDGLEGEALKKYEKLVWDKQSFDMSNKTILGKGSFEIIQEQVDEYTRLGLKIPTDIKKKYTALNSIKTYFEKQGQEMPNNLVEAIEKMALDRVNGKKTPVLKFGKLAKEDDGIASKIQNIVKTTKASNKLTDDEVRNLALRLLHDKGEQISGKKFDKIFDAYLDYTRYAKNTLESDKILRENGIFISPLGQKALSKEVLKTNDQARSFVYKVANNSASKKYREMLKVMSDDEIEIIKRSLSHKKVLDNDMEYKDLLNKIAPTNWSNKNMFAVDNDGLEKLLEENTKREKWLIESMEREVKKSYDGTNFENLDKPIKKYSNELPDDVKEILNKEHDELEKVKKVEIFEPKAKTEVEKEVAVTIEKPEAKTPLNKIKKEEAKVDNIKPIKDTDTVLSKLVDKTKKKEEVIKEVTNKGTQKSDGRGLVFEIEGKKIIIDETTSYKDLQKIVDGGYIADEYIYTDKLKGYGFASGDGKKVGLNPKSHGTREQLVDTLTHENTHVIQAKERINSIGGEELGEFIKGLSDEEAVKLDKLTTAINKQGTAKTSPELLKKRVLTSYIAKVRKDFPGDSVRFVKETDATVASLLLNANPEVAKLSREVFGDDLLDKYFKKICDMGEEDFDKMVADMSYLNRDVPLEKLKKQMASVKEVGNVLLESNKTKEIKELMANLNKDNLQVVDSMVEQIRALNPKRYKEALGEIPTHVKMIDYIEKTVIEDLSGELNEAQLKIYNEVKEYFARYGKEEGIVKEGYEDLFANYVFHMLNPKIKMNEEAYKLAKETFGESIESVFNASRLSRKHKGTIDEINKGFNKALEEAGEEPINLFETNIANIFLKRSIINSDVMYKESRAKMFLDNFALKDHGQFSKEANTVERFEEVLNELGAKDIPTMSKEFKESGQTIYQYLKENAEKHGLNIMDNELFEYGTKTYAQQVLTERFGLGGTFATLKKNAVDYDNVNKRLVKDRNLDKQLYEAKLKAIEDLKAKGLTKDDYIDHKALAKKEGKILITNDDVNIEVYNSDHMKELRYKRNMASKILEEVEGRTGRKSEAYEIAKREYDNINSRYVKDGQRMRREVRDSYKSANDIHFAYSDVEINEQKAYRSMMEHLVNQDEYVKVTKLNPKQYQRYTTVKNPENMTKSLDRDNVLEINADELRSINIAEDSIDTYYIKKRDWENYKQLRDETKYKDKNVFLDIYDKALNKFKAMSLGTGRFITNSAFGNFFESYMTSGVNLANPAMIKKYLQYKAGKDIKIGNLSSDEIRHAFEVFGVNETEILNEMATDSLYKQIKNKIDKPETPLQKLGKKIAPVNAFSDDFFLYKGIRKTQGSIEEMSRFINIATHLERGEDLATAIEWTNKALFDYSDLSKFETDVMKRVIPFYTFMRKNIPLQIKNAGDNIGKTKVLLNIYTELNGMQSEKENALRPDYLDNAIYVGNGKYLNLPNPINDLEKLIKPTEMFSSLTPFAKVPIELATNTQMYSGAKVTKYDDNKERLKYAIDSTFPLFKTYGNALSKAKEGNFAPLANILGVPVKTFDMEKAEQQTMYEYVEDLENQYYRFLEENPEAKQYLEELKKQEAQEKKNKKSQSVLNKLLK